MKTTAEFIQGEIEKSEIILQQRKEIDELQRCNSLLLERILFIEGFLNI